MAPSSPASVSKVIVCFTLPRIVASPEIPLPTRKRVESIRPLAIPQGELPIAICIIKSSVALRIAKRGPARVKILHQEVNCSAHF